jgi:cytochrome c oxidase subunit 2
MIALLPGHGIQSALEPGGLHAERIANLWNLFLGVTAVVYVLVLVVFLYALLRRRSEPQSGSSSGARVSVSIATAVTAVILFVLLVASIWTGRGNADVAANALHLTVTAHQWWWQVEYKNPDQSKRIDSANEINVPVGVPVEIELRSSDVIHSFWVPSLQGKRDLIPGHIGSIVIQAERPGVFRGQCAEFCGLQHAKMALWVNALRPADFARWAAEERAPSRIPSTPAERAGEQVFMKSPCPLCHNVQGTAASGQTGPDLTHFGSRRSIAAGTLPNTRGFLGGWILDPQHIKPGNQMPTMQLEQGELDPLVTYLESLR